METVEQLRGIHLRTEKTWFPGKQKRGNSILESVFFRETGNAEISPRSINSGGRERRYSTVEGGFDREKS